MYHFIGIKGSGTSSLAQIMFDLGYTVQGSDVEKHFFTEEGLHQRKIPVLPYDAKNITPNMKIIQGASIHDDNPELQKAKGLNLSIYTYHEMVGELTKQFKTITIAGCHGKTTTTAMLAHVLDRIEGCNYLIGDGSGKATKNNEYFALEACEYYRHFLSYFPYYAIITNVDLDHVDYFKNMADIMDAYQDYANRALKKVIACGDDIYMHSLNIKKPVVYYGLKEDNDIVAENTVYHERGISFDVIIENNYYGHFDLPLYGKHQLLDALAVLTVCYYENYSADKVENIFKTFKGAKRRFQEEVIGNSVVIDDYAHHPNEAKATLDSIKQKYPDKKIVVIFQPHTFSRTKEFADDFVKVFHKVNKVFVLNIHPSREKQEDFPDVTSHIIVDQLSNGELLSSEENCFVDNDSVYVFMSPNDLSVLENKLKDKLKEGENK